MRSRFLKTTLFCVGTALVACNQAENRTETARDVADARREAGEDVAEAQRDAAEARREAREDVAGADDVGEATEAQRDAARTQAESAQQVAMARIEGEHAVNVQKCEALSGEEQAACKEAADRQRDMEKREVEARYGMP
jgi:hypothetical protein